MAALIARLRDFQLAEMLSKILAGKGPMAQPPKPPGSLASVSFKTPPSTRGLGAAPPFGSKRREPAGNEPKSLLNAVGTRGML